MRIADIDIYKNGNKKVEFFQLGIYELIKTILNYRYIKINEKGYFLKYVNGIYKRSEFYEIKDALTNYIKTEFENLEINGEINIIDFLEAYYKKSPLTNGKPVKLYLSKDFNLSENDLHLLKLETDLQYKNSIEKAEMIDFFKTEDFTREIDKIGNFSKDSAFYFKQISNDTFLTFVDINQNYPKKGICYDFYKINSSNKNQFLNRRNDNIEKLIFGFNLKKDIETYTNEKTCGNTSYNLCLHSN